MRVLRQRDFEPRIFDVPSEDPRGTVVAQQPGPTAQAPPDSRVRINVSTGQQGGQPTERPGTTTPSAGTVSVPDVVGLGQTAALRLLQNLGLRGVVAYRRSSEPVGRVIDQFPKPGSAKNTDARVRILVSSGQETAEALDVPDVRGQDEASAIATLEDAGFRVEVIGEGATRPRPAARAGRDVGRRRRGHVVRWMKSRYQSALCFGIRRCVA